MSESIEKIALEFDHYDRESATCPWPRWARLRKEAPVAWSEKNGGFWVISRYDYITEALRDTETFSNQLKGVTIPSKPVPLLPPSEFDGPAHAAYRHVSNPLLSPEKVAEYLPRIREIVNGYAEPLLEQDAFDATADFAVHVTQDVTQLILGITDAPPDLKKSAEDLVLMRGDREEAGRRLFAFVTTEVEKRRKSPGKDAISQLIGTMYEEDGKESRLLTQDEVVRMTVLLILAGLDTTTSAISGSIWYLLQNPQAQKQLAAADERGWRLAVDEFVRWTAPVTGSARTVAHDAVFHGCPMRAGDRVFVMGASGNRDETAFAQDPNEVVLDRFPNPHVGFGMGPHRCVGSHLAKAELQIALRAMLKGLGNFRLADPERIAWEASNVRGIRSLPLVRK
jgi:cytochrome P450